MSVIEIDPPDTDFRPVLPPDPDEAGRLALLEAMTGFPHETTPELDHFANRVIDLTGADIAGTNRIGKGRKQRFAGMAVQTPEGVISAPEEFREMEEEAGFCNLVLSRGASLVINDTWKSPIHATNPVVLNPDLKIRAYIGTPLWLPDGRFLGTIWGISKTPQQWGMPTLDGMKTLGIEAVELILSRSPEFTR